MEIRVSDFFGNLENAFLTFNLEQEAFDHFESFNDNIDSLIDLQAIEYDQQETRTDTGATLGASSEGVSSFGQLDVDGNSSEFETQSSYTSAQSHQINY